MGAGNRAGSGSGLDRQGSRPSWRLSAGAAARLGVAAIAAFVAASLAVGQRWLAGLDASATGWVLTWRSPGLTDLMRWVSYLGSGWFLAPAGLAVSAWIWRAPGQGPAAQVRAEGRRGALTVVTGLGGSWLLDEALKSLFHRARPDSAWLALASGFAYPSGHSMVTLAFAAVATYVTAATLALRPGAALGLAVGGALFVLAVGASRVYLGVHYPSDVLGGYMAGAAWAFACLAGYEARTGRRNRGPAGGEVSEP